MRKALLSQAAHNKRLERTRHNGSSIGSKLGEPLKRNVGFFANVLGGVNSASVDEESESG